MKTLLMSLALVGLVGVGGQTHAVSNFPAKSIDVVNHRLKHPESMPQGYIGGKKVITGHDRYGNAIVESIQCPGINRPPPCT